MTSTPPARPHGHSRPHSGKQAHATFAGSRWNAASLQARCSRSLVDAGTPAPAGPPAPRSGGRASSQAHALVEHVIRSPLMLRASYLNTMRGLEHGLCVGDIAVFELETCSPDERVADVQRRVRRFDFDNVPIRQNKTITGVVEEIKAFSEHELVGEVATPLSEQMLVAASVPLTSFLPTINQQPYRLVVAEAGIKGLVTPSDVVQLPVRLLVFALLAHLEELMRAAIRQ